MTTNDDARYCDRECTCSDDEEDRLEYLEIRVAQTIGYALAFLVLLAVTVFLASVWR